MFADNEHLVFNNPLIVRNILTNLGKNELLNVRSVSKIFDDECVQVFTKRRNGRWINGKKYFEQVKKLLEESRHPKLLIGKLKIKDEYGYCESRPEFIKMIIQNSEHVQSLRFPNFPIHPLQELVPILNVCSKLVELRYVSSLDKYNLAEVELLSKTSFSFKNLSRLDIEICGKGFESSSNEISFVNGFINKIISASGKLTMFSLRAWPLTPFLKPILEDSNLSKKLSSLKTLHVDGDDEFRMVSIHERDTFTRPDRQTLEENYKEFVKLILLVRNSIECLHVSSTIWKGLICTEWPDMPNLTTISWSEEFKDVPVISQIPSRVKAPNLKLLVFGHREYSKCMWHHKLKNCWTRTFKLDRERKNEDGQGLTVVFTTRSDEDLFSDEMLKLLTDLNAEQLFLDMSKITSELCFIFPFTCLHSVQSLTRLVTRTEYNDSVQVIDHTPLYSSPIWE